MRAGTVSVVNWPQAVIFDLDGTLVDSAPDIAAALNAALARAGHEELPTELVVTFVGGGARLLVERGLIACGGAADGNRVDEVDGHFLEAYAREPAVRTRLYPGALSVLERLRAKGVRLGICTNKPATLTIAILEKTGLTSYFSSIAAADGSLALKPDSGMLRRVLSDLQVEPQNAVMIGDSAADAGCARGADVKCVVLRHGYCHEPITGLGADAVIGCFGELEECLENLRRMV